MGNGASTGQGSHTTCGKRDDEGQSAQISNWPELAGAKVAESSELGRNPHKYYLRLRRRAIFPKHRETISNSDR